MWCEVAAIESISSYSSKGMAGSVHSNISATLKL